VSVVAVDGVTELPVPRVPIVDTVGAGDAFGGGFLAAWTEAGYGRADLADPSARQAATSFAIQVAAVTCERAGADPPTRAELKAGLRARWVTRR
jgi:fructokinase